MTNARDYGAVSWGTLPSDLDVTLVPQLPEGANVTHVYHHYESHEPSLTIRGERNTKGWNVEIGVSGARTVEEAVKLLDALKAEAEKRFGFVQVV